MAGVDDLAERVLGGVDRHGEAQALAAAGGGLDAFVDADDVAGGVDQGAAGVTGIDRGVGLDGVQDGGAALRTEVAVDGRDDPRSERELESQGVADRYDGLADLDRVGVAHRQRIELEAGGIDGDHRHVGLRVDALDGALHAAGL